jgi:hypothetical protein
MPYFTIHMAVHCFWFRQVNKHWAKNKNYGDLHYITVCILLSICFSGSKAHSLSTAIISQITCSVSSDNGMLRQRRVYGWLLTRNFWINASALHSRKGISDRLQSCWQYWQDIYKIAKPAHAQIYNRLLCSLPHHSTNRRPFNGSGGTFPASRRGGPSSIPGQSMWDLR